ncbi:uncharacterized protein LOC121377704 [Gigantopelta aegis]|uniref:uncharacterized protein LOC121377704 n=1 Tax=Gigantopelta aegis TaxID=1735272 RepID=UPI001B88D8B6|nr:uncharacterized protein LOC121377704 [Gigantopelta aegis]
MDDAVLFKERLWGTAGLVTVGIMAAGVGLLFYMRRKSKNDPMKDDLIICMNTLSDMNFASDYSLSLETFVSSSESSVSELDSTSYPEFDISRLLTNTGMEGIPDISVEPIHSPGELAAEITVPPVDPLEIAEPIAPPTPAVRAASALSVAVSSTSNRQLPRRRVRYSGGSVLQQHQQEQHQQTNRKRYHLEGTPPDDFAATAYSNNACEGVDVFAESELNNQKDAHSKIFPVNKDGKPRTEAKPVSHETLRTSSPVLVASDHEKRSGAVTSSDHAELYGVVTSFDHKQSSHHMTSSHQWKLSDSVTTSHLGKPSALKKVSVTFSDQMTSSNRVTSSNNATTSDHFASSGRVASSKIGDVGLNICSRLYLEMSGADDVAFCKMPHIVTRCSDVFQQLMAAEKLKQQHQKLDEEFKFMTSLGNPNWDEVLSHHTPGMSVRRVRRNFKLTHHERKY